ncbi:MAG: hypothetical protein ACK48P_00705 [Holosporales bacterium]|jgi:hypothetical protein
MIKACRNHLLFVALLLLTACATKPLVFTSQDPKALVVAAIEVDPDAQRSLYREAGQYYSMSTFWYKKDRSVLNQVLDVVPSLLVGKALGGERFTVHYNSEEGRDPTRNIKKGDGLIYTPKDLTKPDADPLELIDPTATTFYTIQRIEPGDYYLVEHSILWDTETFNGTTTKTTKHWRTFTPENKIYAFSAQPGEIVYLGMIKMTAKKAESKPFGRDWVGRLLYGSNAMVAWQEPAKMTLPFIHAEGLQEAQDWLFKTYPQVERKPLLFKVKESKK